MTDELSPDARRLLDATRDGDLPSDADRERLRAKVAMAIGGAGAAAALGAASEASASAAAAAGGAASGAAGAAAAGASAAASSAAAGAAAGSWATAKLAWVLAGAVAVGGGVAVVAGPAEGPHAARTHGAGTGEAGTASTGVKPTAAWDARASDPSAAPAPQAPPQALPPAADHVADGTALRAADASGSSDAPRASARPRQPHAPAAAPTALHVDNARAGSIQAELTLVGAAQHYLRNGDAAEALQLLDRHRGRFPDGALVQERVAARAMALCALQRHAEAHGELQALERNAPGTPLLARVKAACAKPPSE